MPCFRVTLSDSATLLAEVLIEASDATEAAKKARLAAAQGAADFKLAGRDGKPLVEHVDEA